MYVIHNRHESTAEGWPMFWGCEIGWGDLTNATVYSAKEKETYTHLPGIGSEWMPLSQAKMMSPPAFKFN